MQVGIAGLEITDEQCIFIGAAKVGNYKERSQVFVQTCDFNERSQV